MLFQANTNKKPNQTKPVRKPCFQNLGFPGGSDGNEPSCQCRRLRLDPWVDPLEKEMATHFSVLAWRIPWTEELGGLPSMGLQRVGHDWATNTFQASAQWLFQRGGSWGLQDAVAREKAGRYSRLLGLLAGPPALFLWPKMSKPRSLPCGANSPDLVPKQS